MSGGVGPFLINPVAAEVGFSPWQLSCFASSLFAGMWVGSFVGGLLCDAFGPGRTMAVALFVLACASLAPVMLPAAGVTKVLLVILFCGARLAIGLGMVICFQAGNTYVAEACPTELRSAYMALLHVGIAVGAILSAAFALLLPSEAWRGLLVLSACPIAVAAPFMLRFVLRNESPRWLVVAGHEDKCRQLLARISRACVAEPLQPADPLTAPEEDTEFEKLALIPAVVAAEGETEARKAAGLRCEDGGGFVARLRMLLHPSLFQTYAVGTLIAFVLNFGNKGFEAWLAPYIERAGMPALARGCAIGGSLGKIVGDLISMLPVAQRLGRLRMLQYSFGACAATIVAFVHADSPVLLLATSFATGVFSDIIWCHIYMLLAESFPTAVRSTAFGIVLGLGRTGGVIGAAVGGAVAETKTVFLLYAASYASGAVFVCMFGGETSHLPLPDTV